MYNVNWSLGIATEVVNTKKGLRKNTYAVFVDDIGVFIMTRFKKIYLTKDNSLFL